MWLAHQRQGFFGWTLGASTPQPRWPVVVDIADACARVADVLAAWWDVVAWPEVPAYSGGLLDSWPSRMREGLAVARSEWAAVVAYQRHEARAEAAKRREVKHG